MEQILQWVKKLAVFMILSGYMEHLLPAGYRRYFHMCMGLILILMIGTPLFQLLNGTMGRDFAYLLEDLRIGSRVYQTEEASARAFQDYYMTQYKAAIEAQIRQLTEANGLTALTVDFTVEEDVQSRQYGYLQSLTMTAKADGDAGASAAELRQSLSDQLGLRESRIQIEIETVQTVP